MRRAALIILGIALLVMPRCGAAEEAAGGVPGGGRISTEPTAAEMQNEGAGYFSRGEYDKAIEIYEAALSKPMSDATRADILFNLSSAYLEKGVKPYVLNGDDSSYRKAIGYAEECLKVDPVYWKALANLGVIAMNMNELEKADRYYTEAERMVDPASSYVSQLVVSHGIVKAVIAGRRDQAQKKARTHAQTQEPIQVEEQAPVQEAAQVTAQGGEGLDTSVASNELAGNPAEVYSDKAM